MRMKYNTLLQRMNALAIAWCRIHGKTTYKMATVAWWWQQHGLYPVPKHRAGFTASEFEAWEKKLEDVENSYAEREGGGDGE